MGKSVEMHQVTSSNVSEVGYDDETKELHVKYGSGTTIYVYKDVPKEKFDRLLNPENSVGRLIAKEIKGIHLFDKREPGKETGEDQDS